MTGIAETELADYADRVVRLARDCLDGRLDAAYIVGSVASADARPDVSDLDVLLVTPHELDGGRRQDMGERLADAAQDCPLRGMEAVLYLSSVLARPAHPLRYELNVNGGRGMARRIKTGGDPAFWFLLDVSAAREHAVVLAGPPAVDVIGAVPNEAVRAAIVESLEWHGARPADANAVLNACRAWHWLEEGHWLSKTRAGEWAVGRGGGPVVTAALAAREGGRDANLDQSAAEVLRGRVLREAR